MNKTTRMILLFGPFLLFVILALLFVFRLVTVDPNRIKDVPNALAGRPVPETMIPRFDGNGEIDPKNFFKDQIKLVNFWGSWCRECRIEHPFLTKLSTDPRFDLIGINFKDSKDNATRFLNAYGSPYKEIGLDAKGRIAIDWGVFGAPETFLVDQNGLILYKHIGVLTDKIFNEKFLPIIENHQSNMQ